MKRTILIMSIMMILVSACKTTQDLSHLNEQQDLNPTSDVLTDQEIKDQLLKSDLDSVRLEKEVIYINKPMYIPKDENVAGDKKEKAITGINAVKKGLSSALQVPQKYSSGAFLYDFDEKEVFQIYCAPYRITDLQLQPGEQILETPYISEPDVWQISGGVSKKQGLDVQHLFLKPDTAKLVSSLIIITNKRVYHTLLKSYTGDYMPIVRWNYPKDKNMLLAQNFTSTSIVKPLNHNGGFSSGFVPENLNFSYIVKYSKRYPPHFVPKKVFDDGHKTYIELSKDVLHKQMPALFNHQKDILNYRVLGRYLIIDQLIDKAILKLNKEVVFIEKKDE